MAMYSRYLPPDTPFFPLPSEDEEPFHQPQPESGAASSENISHSNSKPAGHRSSNSDLLGELTGGISEFLGGLFKHFSLKNLDSGDVLLLLIILFLFLEGDNLDLVIALGLMLLLGLGEAPQSST